MFKRKQKQKAVSLKDILSSADGRGVVSFCRAKFGFWDRVAMALRILF